MIAATCIIAAAAAVLSGLLIMLSRPMLVRYALAHPNARSSHRIPTPQGGGVAIVTATILTAVAANTYGGGTLADSVQASLFGPVIFMAVIGAMDDLWTIPPLYRLALQGMIVGFLVFNLDATIPVLDLLPEWLRRIVLFTGLLWFVNVVNFMDGIDWISVTEVVPVTAALALLGWSGALPAEAPATAAALCGAMLGFAPFNRPVARLFLGDVGSLPVGLLLGWLLILLAERHLAAALLLPLYYLADASVTLLRRLARGERITQAHRSHFYQQAVHGSLSVRQVVGRIFAVNIALALLAFASLTASAALQALALAAGAALVAMLLLSFSRAGAAPR